MNTTANTPTDEEEKDKAAREQARLILNILFSQHKKERRLTQRDLARLTGYEQGTISNHLSGGTPLPTKAVITYAKAFGVEPGVIDPRLTYLNPNANLGCIESGAVTPLDEDAPVLHDAEEIDAWLKGNTKKEGRETIWLPPDLRGHRAFAVRGGDLNIPETKPTDYLIIDPQNRPLGGCYGLWILKGSLQAGKHKVYDGTLYAMPPPPFTNPILLGDWDERFVGRIEILQRRGLQ